MKKVTFTLIALVILLGSLPLHAANVEISDYRLYYIDDEGEEVEAPRFDHYSDVRIWIELDEKVFSGEANGNIGFLFILKGATEPSGFYIGPDSYGILNGYTEELGLPSIRPQPLMDYDDAILNQQVLNEILRSNLVSTPTARPTEWELFVYVGDYDYNSERWISPEILDTNITFTAPGYVPYDN